jgi:CBS domain-containing protein
MRLQDVTTDQVIEISPDTSAEIAWDIMRRRRIHHLLVTHEGRIVGILSARDFGGIKGARARELHTVGDLMTRDVVTVSITTSIRRAADIMRSRGIRCLVVLKAGRVAGIVTDADLRELPRSRLYATRCVEC